MNIRMAGIDYRHAPVEVRERFAMATSAAREALARVRERGCAEECVLLSTCNRTELWLAGGEEPPGRLLCELRGVDPDAYLPLPAGLSGRKAASYLFELACGMKSQIFGEDQIVTQVGGALSLARECGAAGPVLEMLFRSAVTAAKQVKTSVRLTGADRSAATGTVDFLRARMALAGCNCLVIGNGEMGRLAACELVKAGCRVRMTVRRYHHGEVVIPEGCGTVPYEARLESLPWARLVVSATTSPHYTLRAREIGALAHPTVFCDLAVPRDIDPRVAALPGARLYDTDRLCGREDARRDEQALAAAREILDGRLAEFERWYGFRRFVPAAQEIGALVAGDQMERVGRELRQAASGPEDAGRLAARVRGAAEKSVARMLYGLREQLDPALWEACFEGLRKAAREGDKR